MSDLLVNEQPQMTAEECRALVLRAMAQYKGDDLERANGHFFRMTEDQLDADHGASGLTRREAWENYKAERRRYEQAMQWLKARIGEFKRREDEGTAIW